MNTTGNTALVLNWETAGPDAGEVDHHGRCRTASGAESVSRSLSDDYGVAEQVIDLIPFMLEAFIQSDKGFARGGRK